MRPRPITPGKLRVGKAGMEALWFLAAVMCFSVAFGTYRFLAMPEGAVQELAVVMEATAETIPKEEKDLRAEITRAASDTRKLLAGARVVTAADLAPPEEQGSTGPDGRPVAGRQGPDQPAAEGQGAAAAEIPSDALFIGDAPSAEVHIAQQAMTISGSLRQYAGFLADTAQEAEETAAVAADKRAELAAQAAAAKAAGDEPPDGWDPEQAAIDEQQAEAVTAQIAERRAAANELIVASSSIGDLAGPLLDPQAWMDRVRIMALYWGLGASIIPLAIAIALWFIDRRRRLKHFHALDTEHGLPSAMARRRNERRNLNYSLYTAYSLHVLVILAALLGLSRCALSFGVPGGGGGVVGEESEEEQVVVKQIKRRKLIVNPYSSVILSQPPELEINIEEVTKRMATAQQAGGEGEGSGGYEGGQGAEVPFVVLNHGGPQWDEALKNAGGSVAGSELLKQIRSRMGMPTARQPAEVTVGQLQKQRNPALQPPILYMSIGRGGYRLSDSDLSWLANVYTRQIGGMIIVDAMDSGATRHAQALSRRLFGSGLSVVPRDDVIMRIRENLTRLSFEQLKLTGHGGDRILGYKDRASKRWLMIYHPGDLVDGWRGAYGSQWQEHAFKIGMNVWDYAMSNFTRLQTGRDARTRVLQKDD